jgi:hypothetical protein
MIIIVSFPEFHTDIIREIAISSKENRLVVSGGTFRYNCWHTEFFVRGQYVPFIWCIIHLWLAQLFFWLLWSIGSSLTRVTLNYFYRVTCSQFSFRFRRQSVRDGHYSPGRGHSKERTAQREQSLSMYRCSRICLVASEWYVLHGCLIFTNIPLRPIFGQLHDRRRYFPRVWYSNWQATCGDCVGCAKEGK